jgi:ATP-dependent RNA helicase DDX5/DBP2
MPKKKNNKKNIYELNKIKIIALLKEKNKNVDKEGFNKKTHQKNDKNIVNESVKDHEIILDGYEYRKFHKIEIEGIDENGIDSYKCPDPILTFTNSICNKIIKKNLLAAGFTEPMPIQGQSWPICQEGRDIISIARTGSGKTLGFLLPAFNKIKKLQARGIIGGKKNSQECFPLCVVLVPTRELAMQVGIEAIKYGRLINIRSVIVYGGEPKGKQMYIMKRLNPQMIIGTPGRLIDFCKMGKINLSRTCLLILDEADRMLDMGFEPQLNEILTFMPTQKIDDKRPLPSSDKCDQYSRQTLLFSATWPVSMRRICARFTYNPIQLNIGNSKLLIANEMIEQTVLVLKESQKMDKCREIIKSLTPDDKVIVFISTKIMCDMITNSLQNEGINCDAIHGGKNQLQRTRILNAFKSSKIRIMFATDVAARGLDIVDISHVICYDFPKPKGEGGIESFVHRIGRTARGSRKGKAITFFTRENSKHTNALIKLLERAKQIVPDELKAMVEKRGKFRGNLGRGGKKRSYRDNKNRYKY